jgi:septum site-determining protein MinD
VLKVARKIVITSGKGGVGKTTVCANLGLHLANLGLRVVMLDVDIGLNNLDVVMGVENKVVFDLVDVIERRCRIKQALIQDFYKSSLYILPSVHSYNANAVSGETIKKIIDTMNNFFDYILIDCPAGIDAPFTRAITGADEAIVVVTPHLSSLRDGDKVINILHSQGLKPINLVVNRVRGDLIVDKEIMNVLSIAEALKVHLVGAIPEDDNIAGGLLRVNVSEGYRAFSLLAQNLQNETNKIFDCTYKYKGLIGNLKRNLRRKI